MKNHKNHENHEHHKHENGKCIHSNENGEKSKYFGSNDEKKCMNCEKCNCNGKKQCNCGCDTCCCNESATACDTCCG